MSATWQIIEGGCREVLRSLPERSVHTCVTSPPFYGLRDYNLPPSTWADGWIGCLGLEPTPDRYVVHLVEVFREVRRVLRDDATLWLNLGDSYASTGTTRWPNTSDGYGNGYGKHGAWHGGESVRPAGGEGVKPKDLIGIPWLVAFALRGDGWYLRSEIIWAKKNCMPEISR